MAACDPKATLALSASTVRYFSQRLLNPNTIGANHAPATKTKRADPLRGPAFLFLLLRRGLNLRESRFTRSRSDAGASRTAARATEARSAEGQSCLAAKPRGPSCPPTNKAAVPRRPTNIGAQRDIHPVRFIKVCSDTPKSCGSDSTFLIVLIGQKIISYTSRQSYAHPCGRRRSARC